MLGGYHITDFCDTGIDREMPLHGKTNDGNFLKISILYLLIHASDDKGPGQMVQLEDCLICIRSLSAAAPVFLLRFYFFRPFITEPVLF